MAEDTSSLSVAGPPAAHVRTFLFADLRGYTRYTREHGDDAASALAGRFADLVRQAVPEFDGELLELRGDEALCVFGSARQALRASVELQTRLRAPPDDDPFPLGVGMGLDAGEAVPTQGGYRGDALNLAARLCSIAGPGQTLASETVMALSRRVEGLHYSAPRHVRLKGMHDPVRIVEVLPDHELPPVMPLKAPSQKSRWLFAAAAVVAIVVAVLLVVVLTRSTAAPISLKPDRVAEIDPASLTVNQAVRISEPPTAMATGEGSVWAAEANAGQVERIYPSGGGVPIQVGSEPSAVVFAFDQLWVANTGDGTVRRVNTQNQPLPPIPVGNGPSALVATQNRVWVANRLDDALVQIDSAGNVVGNPIQLGAPPSGLAAIRGYVWVAQSDAGQVVQIDEHNGQAVNSVSVQNGPTAIAAGAGRVFVANGDGTVTAINPGSAKTLWTKTVGGSPGGIAVVGGSVWVSDMTSNHITELSPSGQIERRVTVGAETGAITATGGTMWITTLPSLSTHRGGTLVGVVGQGYLASQSPDPALETDGLGAAMASLSNDGLVSFRKVSGSGGYELVPNLAQSLPQPTDGGRTYTFQLRRRIRYSNGQTLKPADVRWSFERTYLSGGVPLAGGDIAGSSRCIGNGLQPVKRCNLETGIASDVASYTVTFHLSHADPDFLDKLAGFQAIVPAGTPTGKKEGNIVPGTGPYVAVKYQVIPAGKRDAGQGEIVYARNPHFHVWSAFAEPAGYPNRIVFKGIPGTGSGADDLRLVERGKADWTADYPFPANQISQVEARYPAQLHILTLDETDYAQLNTHIPPFTNLLVRQAVNYAIDRRLLLRTAGGGPYAGAITCQFLPPSFPGYRPYCPYTTNPNAAGTWTSPDLARAQTLVRRSGTRGQSIVVWGANNDPIAHYLQRLLSQLGYHTSLRLFGVGTAGADNLLTAANTQKEAPPIANWFGWGIDYPGGDDFLGLFTCASNAVSLNSNIYCSHTYDTMVAKALSAEQTNPNQANTLWTRADHYLTDQAATIPLWHERGLVFLSRRVGGFQYLATGFGYPLFDQLWVR